MKVSFRQKKKKLSFSENIQLEHVKVTHSPSIDQDPTVAERGKMVTCSSRRENHSSREMSCVYFTHYHLLLSNHPQLVYFSWPIKNETKQNLSLPPSTLFLKTESNATIMYKTYCSSFSLSPHILGLMERDPRAHQKCYFCLEDFTILSKARSAGGKEIKYGSSSLCFP